MRQFQILFLLSLASLGCLAQEFDYRPFIEEGKRWTYSFALEYYSDEHNHLYWYSLEGDTVIGGRKCLKMFSENYNNDCIVRYVGAFYEEQKKVYVFLPEQETADLLYDFGCEVGDEVRVFGNRMIFTDIFQEEYGGIITRSYSLLWISDDGKRYAEGCTWVEGVGGIIDLFLMVPTEGASRILERCEVNGKVLFEWPEIPTGISSHPSTKNSSKPSWYSLSGHRLTTPPMQKGVYIRNGKQVIVK